MEVSPNPFDLGGRRAIVTGGGGGIGAGLAAGLHAAGASIVLIGRSSTVDEVAAELGASGPPVHAVRADLTDRRAATNAFEEATGLLGGLEILINCHGRAYVEDSTEFDLDQWDVSIETNLTSVFVLSQLAGRHMLEHGHGSIINIASMLSYIGGLKAPAYAAAKGGIVQLTKALSNEWSSSGVRVNAIAPGYVKTKLNKHVWGDPERAEATVGRIPIGRWGVPLDLAGTAVFLASDASAYVTGATIPVDGGFLAK